MEGETRNRPVCWQRLPSGPAATTSGTTTGRPLGDGAYFYSLVALR